MLNRRNCVCDFANRILWLSIRLSIIVKWVPLYSACRAKMSKSGSRQSDESQQYSKLTSMKSAEVARLSVLVCLSVNCRIKHRSESSQMYLPMFENSSKRPEISLWIRYMHISGTCNFSLRYWKLFKRFCLSVWIWLKLSCRVMFSASITLHVFRLNFSTEYQFTRRTWPSSVSTVSDPSGPASTISWIDFAS